VSGCPGVPTGVMVGDVGGMIRDICHSRTGGAGGGCHPGPSQSNRAERRSREADSDEFEAGQRAFLSLVNRTAS
jgi:hypothetical protein